MEGSQAEHVAATLHTENLDWFPSEINGVSEVRYNLLQPPFLKPECVRAMFDCLRIHIYLMPQLARFQLA